MPFKSESQRRYLWKFNPDIARRFAADSKKNDNLPKKKNYGDNIKSAMKKGK